ncbi:hypothetical protein DACRYDRAFT_52279 [Dacryopinax primogenitus]|uniref:Integrase core domain-containing protein n=1 Tax=Dacryopinax primogenitus (strain DJM 731) TaxID=1858805 RepID=M5G0R9_DACPD|nr:uncharacterized protein DACRYDRAFT_52279 [Dacryopinax primogenitus]EJU01710.1 hypothetical protein DACRYDRAFT_52279 [Dacryopinax primogenitus]
MVEHHGANWGSYIWGQLVHNTHIERMWVDVTNSFGWKWALFFLNLEADEGLNHQNNDHLWLLHWLFLQDINNNGTGFQNEWNFHTMSLAEGNQCPADLFLKGCLQHSTRGIQLVTRNDQHYYMNPGSYGSEVDIKLAEAEEDQLEGFIHTHGIANQMPACLSNIDSLPPDCPLSAEHMGQLVNELAPLFL